MCRDACRGALLWLWLPRINRRVGCDVQIRGGIAAAERTTLCCECRKLEVVRFENQREADAPLEIRSSQAGARKPTAESRKLNRFLTANGPSFALRGSRFGFLDSCAVRLMRSDYFFRNFVWNVIVM